MRICSSTDRPPSRPRGRPFAKGPDPRRHALTYEERHRGYLGALHVLSQRGPDSELWLRRRVDHYYKRCRRAREGKRGQ